MTHPTDPLRLVQELRAAANGMFNLKNERGDYGYFDSLADRFESLAAAPASPLPEGGGQLSKNLGQLKSGQCSGISGELDPRLVEWGYTSLDEAITHLGKILDDQAAFDGLAAPTGAK